MLLHRKCEGQRRRWRAGHACTHAQPFAPTWLKPEQTMCEQIGRSYLIMNRYATWMLLPAHPCHSVKFRTELLSDTQAS